MLRIRHADGQREGTSARMSAIKVVDYDPAWPGLFEEEKSRSLKLIGDIAEDIHHVGRTSVGGLGAKPKIDIDAVLRSNPMVAEAVGRVRRACRRNKSNLV